MPLQQYFSLFKQHLAILSYITAKSQRHTPKDSSFLVHQFNFRCNKKKKISTVILIHIFLSSFHPQNSCRNVEFICYKTWANICTVISEWCYPPLNTWSKDENHSNLRRVTSMTSFTSIVITTVIHYLLLSYRRYKTYYKIMQPFFFALDGCPFIHKT